MQQVMVMGCNNGKIVQDAVASVDLLLSTYAMDRRSSPCTTALSRRLYQVIRACV